MNKILFLLLISILSFSCRPTNTLPEPKVKEGIAKISGKIIKNIEGTPILNLSIHNPVTGEPTTFKTQINKDGNFSFIVPVETDLAIATLYSDFFNSTIIVGLAVNEETKLKISFGEAGKMNVDMTGRIPLNSYDITNGIDLLIKMDQYSFYDTLLITGIRPLYDKSPNFFIQSVMDNINYRIEKVVVNDTNLSQQAKNYMTNDFKLCWIANTVFYYSQEMVVNFEQTNSKEKWNDFIPPQQPDKSYYSFLKDLDLNNPQYLYCGEHTDFMGKILSNDTLNIPPINETPIDNWLKEVKKTLSDLVGFDEGLFYDLLISNAYALQFKNELKPLSEKQRNNINAYFKGGEIEKILLRKNEKIIKLNSKKIKLVINETPTVAKEKLMDAIISKYKGKVVLIDFWATWCSPCLKAIIDSRELKDSMRDKDVVFVYISGETSPHKLWEEKLAGIGSEHYYLTQEEWGYIMDSFNFDGIPSYLIYDKNNVLKEKLTGYPGNEAMKNMIESLY
ncbi:MAG: TlpA family protein disulfide reductase [Prevotella sp.]|jgi:thiol-disulfide isomerase/thioredoxin|nr:TlpA family protein disulfide reductase [Prevotella sp.]